MIIYLIEYLLLQQEFNSKINDLLLLYYYTVAYYLC